MAKTKSNTSTNQSKNKTSDNTFDFIPERFQNAIALVLLGLLLIVFFREPLLGDGSF